MTKTVADTVPTVVDCRAPEHAPGSKRLMLTPGAVSLGDGPNGHAVLLLRLGRPDGSVVSLFRGTSLYGAAEVATGAIRDRRPDAVWVTDRGYLRGHWSPWTLRTVEARLVESAEEVDAPLLTWTGRESASGTRDYAES